MLATAFHEIGHASAVRYGGARPGVMGVGIYIVWPAFYTDITDAYRLGKWGRLRADTGGMYFNALFALAIGGAYSLTGLEPLLLLIVAPELRDHPAVAAVPAPRRLLHHQRPHRRAGHVRRIKPVLRSLIPRPPGRRARHRAQALGALGRPAYVLTVIPVLGLAILLMVVHAPRAFATAYDSVALHYQHAGPAFRDGQDAGPEVMDVVQMLVLVLPGDGPDLTPSSSSAARPGRPRGAGPSGTPAWKRPVLAIATAERGGPPRLPVVAARLLPADPARRARHGAHGPQQPAAGSQGADPGQPAEGRHRARA